MTTHDEQTMTDSPEDSVSETPRLEDDSTAGTPEQAPAVETAAPAAQTRTCRDIGTQHRDRRGGAADRGTRTINGRSAFRR